MGRMNAVQNSDGTFRTVIPEEDDIYSSFPSFVEYNGKILIFYRQARRSSRQAHGTGGVVRCLEIEKETFVQAFAAESEQPLRDFGSDSLVFESENELDAIVSRVEEDLYTLATRTYIKEKKNIPYATFSDRPVFADRHAPQIKDVSWYVFYGKAFHWEDVLVFPAYGGMGGELCCRPLLLATPDRKSWELLSYLPGKVDERILNETSVVFDGEKYQFFVRDESPPFGIWYGEAEDLRKPSLVKKVVDSAHAPTALHWTDRTILTFRELIDEKTSAVSLRSPWSAAENVRIETYAGNPYDGGYSDLGVIDGQLYVVYYLGNERGQPSIRACRLGTL